jgi:uncharacterized membrane protein YkvA (DUF1232 family)
VRSPDWQNPVDLEQREGRIFSENRSNYAGLRELLRAVGELQSKNANALAEATEEIEGLVRLVERAMVSGDLRSAKIRKATAALAYLKDPYDHIFDLHIEGGFIDDIAVVREAWMSIQGGPR